MLELRHSTPLQLHPAALHLRGTELLPLVRRRQRSQQIVCRNADVDKFVRAQARHVHQVLQGEKLRCESVCK